MDVIRGNRHPCNGISIAALDSFSLNFAKLLPGMGSGRREGMLPLRPRELYSTQLAVEDTGTYENQKERVRATSGEYVEAEGWVLPGKHTGDHGEGQQCRAGWGAHPTTLRGGNGRGSQPHGYQCSS